MTLQEPSALPDRARRVRWGYFGVRLLLVVALLALAALLPGLRSGGDRFHYREGDIMRERVVAPYDFRVEKDEATLRREQAQAAATVPPVFVVDTRVSAEMLARLATFQEKVFGVVLSAGIKPADRAGRVRALGVTLSEENAIALSAPGRARRALRELGGWLNDLYRAGVVAEKRNGTVQGDRSINLRDGESEAPRSVSLLYDRREALALIARRAQTAFPDDPPGVRLVTELAGPFLQANIVADRAETEWRRVQAQGAVPALTGFVKKDELIVDANQKLTREMLNRLRSLENLDAAQQEPRELFYPPLARALLMLLFMAAFVTYLRMELPAVYRDNAMLALFTLLTTIVVAAAESLVGVFGFPVLVVPLAAAPLVTASVLEKRPAVVFTLLLAVMVTAVSELKAPFVAMAVMGGVTAVYSVARLRHRWHFAVAAFFIAFANLFAILTWDLGQQAKPEVLAHDAAWGVAGAFLAVALAYVLLPVAEHLFGLTSDITLLELSDLNRPLLKRMQLEAPGTYHHSMVVGSLAERAAEAIGANSLLARVSAYYHDIGKLAKPEYFNENMLPHMRNPHEKLSPNMSTLIVKSHLNEGLELARREHLPRAVRAAIPEHHGTMAMAFFYGKALDQDPGARREDYSYPGPRPRSRETAILMLADGVEGASRALTEPTPSRIRGLVTRTIDERVQQGQLDECGLTLQELAKIREAFIPVLIATFHVRVKYPELPRPADARLRR
jgi:putative nucleotidyltransferase with HDIG domain